MAISSIESSANSVCTCRCPRQLPRPPDQQVIDNIVVVAGETDHRVGAEAAIEQIVVSGAGAADQEVVAVAAEEVVVAGAAEDQVVSGRR